MGKRGVLEWWSGGVVEWWSGGVMIFFSILQYSTTPILPLL